MLSSFFPDAPSFDLSFLPQTTFVVISVDPQTNYQAGYHLGDFSITPVVTDPTQLGKLENALAGRHVYKTTVLGKVNFIFFLLLIISDNIRTPRVGWFCLWDRSCFGGVPHHCRTSSLCYRYCGQQNIQRTVCFTRCGTTVPFQNT